MFIPVEQRPATPVPHALPVAAATPVSVRVAKSPQPPFGKGGRELGERGDLAQPAAPEVTEELLIEEVSIDGMCGVY